MAEYRPELDEKVATVAECVIGNMKYRISVYRYNKGEMKIAYEFVFGMREDGSEAARNVNTRLPVEVARFFAANTQKALDKIDEVKNPKKAPAASITNTLASKKPPSKSP